jgi:UDP:flavonoid glycosyltransferase YjiC (YdhE family)
LRRKVVLATVGSLGDLHPFIALGRALGAHGVDTVLASAVEYRSKIEASGIAFHPLRPSFGQIERDLGIDRAHLTQRAIEDSAFLFRDLVIPYVRIAFDDMMEATADADLVITSSLAFAARFAAEKRGIPSIALVLQPMMFLSAYDPPVIPRAEWLSVLLRRLGPSATRIAVSALKGASKMLFRPLRALRAELGLAPDPTDPLFDGQFGSGGAIAMYSPLLGTVQPDYPRPTSIVGFAAFDSEDGAASRLDPELQAFLERGAAPLVFTLGSTVVNSPGSFFRESLSAARALGARAVLTVGVEAPRESAGASSADVCICAYAPHSLVFPRAAAIVHHGGIGTLAQALLAGRPQLIVPHFADQLDNAARARRLGVARVLAPRRYRAASAAREIAQLQGADGYPDRAREVGNSLAGEDGAEQAARVVLDRLEVLGRK